MNQRVNREQVAFKSGGDVTLAGYLYRPTGQPAGPLPCVVMAHGFSGTMDRLFRHAERFAQAGLAVLVFDYRNFGASGGQPRQLIDLEGQQADWRAAIGFARDHQDLDPRRIALWGSSLGGAHAITVAAADPALAAVVAQIPWLGDGRPAGRKLRHALRLTSLKLTVAAVRDAIHASQGRPPLLVPVLGEPGTTAMFTDPEARQALAAKGTQGTLWRNEFAPRMLFSMARYAPAAVMDRLAMPLLVCLADRDQDIPVDWAQAVVARAPKGQVRRYPGSHFGLYHGALYERVVADQLQFLTAHLLSPAPVT
jgi:dienelactone hydrolase